MFPFWDLAIAPVLEAIDAKRIVEIGALRGETTVLMLERLGPDAELHVIDPVPEFDPTEHERAFPGRYIFHRALSHDVLSGLPSMDAALIDGDHNWYTVYHELRLLSDTARQAGDPLPVMILHDVLWPYGRRDLYYAPEQIPEEFRQPYAQQGMRMGKKELLPRGGLNPTMYNARTEGGPRNGVMTALDDFVEEYDRPLRRVVLPIYFGLAIVVEAARLVREPRLAEHLDWLESNEGQHALLQLAEDVRLRAMLFQHNIFFSHEGRIERSATRYLDVLKDALLDEHYFENELRIDYLAQCVERGQRAEANPLREPSHFMRDERRRLEAARRSGRQANDGELAQAHRYFPYTTMGRVRLDHLQSCLETVRTESVKGDLVECGTGRGGGAILLRGFLEAHELKEPSVWVADRFRASPRSGPPSEGDTRLPGGGRGFPALLADLNAVREAFARFRLLDERVRFLQGPLVDTLRASAIEKVALLRIGDDLDDDAGEIIDALYDKVVIGGFVVIDGTADPGRRKSIDEFRMRAGVAEPIERIDDFGTFWRKTAPAGLADQPGAKLDSPVPTANHAPLAASRPAPRKDLSVVVVFYNMRREAKRTLHSLSRSYQQGIDDIDYEVIAVENGSRDDQKLGEEYVRGFGPEFRYVDLGTDATPSPVPALNRGIAEAGGDAIALMIDGAHVLTPGVLRFGLAGIAAYRPAVVSTQQWYVGPGQQPEISAYGYDADYEDRLFDEIEWPKRGYGLFDIGHFIGDRDWFDGIWESNCMFVPRALLEQFGCFDESFSMPGGGYANLELYERVASTPGIAVVSIIGEGSFHQVHGGTTTNNADAGARRQQIAAFTRHYEELRGRGFRGPGKQIHYVGHMHPGARRTKARRRVAPNLFKAGTAADLDAMPEKPSPLPEDLKVEFTDAFWRSLAWRDTTWLGRRVAKAPTDLVAYQELIATVRPDWIIETGTLDGGRAFFLASICDLIGHGQVLSIDEERSDDRPAHPRIVYLQGNSISDTTVRKVLERVGEAPNALVVLGSCGSRPRMVKEFRAYAPLVPVGSYVVMEETIVGGHPVWPSFGPGPAEAVSLILNTRDDFAPDPAMERYGLTFNPNGFLKRLK
jgi:cephalosporin hydroxylase/glycosyltransferase involved in cell wall biosynthesis